MSVQAHSKVRIFLHYLFQSYLNIFILAFLSDLSEPLLTDAYYKAHCQVAEMSDSDPRKIQCLQLLFLLIPEANFLLIRDLLKMLSQVNDKADLNKMNAGNLATVFATHILCPRKISPDCLQSKHQLFIKAVTFMIENVLELFSMPQQLVQDVEVFWQKNKDRDITTLKVAPDSKSSPVVNTIYSFVDQRRTKEAMSQSTTEVAIAELYAQIQKMPESAQKKKLIRSFNDANGMGTPSLASKRKPDASSKLKNLLTPRSKATGAAKKQKKEGKTHGSYNLSSSRAVKFDEAESTPSYKRQNSGTSGGKTPTLTTFTDASPTLKPASKPLPPPPPPRSSSLKKEEEPQKTAVVDEDPKRSEIMTPRSRKPIFHLSPTLESPEIEEEAQLLLSGKLQPTKSQLQFLNNENLPIDHHPIETVNESTPDKLRKRSLTELGGAASHLVKNPPLQNCQNAAYFETDF